MVTKSQKAKINLYANGCRKNIMIFSMLLMIFAKNDPNLIKQLYSALTYMSKIQELGNIAHKYNSHQLCQVSCLGTFVYASVGQRNYLCHCKHIRKKTFMKLTQISTLC